MATLLYAFTRRHGNTRRRMYTSNSEVSVKSLFASEARQEHRLFSEAQDLTIGICGKRLRSSTHITLYYSVTGRSSMARRISISDEMREQFALARKRGAEALRTEPHGRAVRFSKAKRELIIDLINGCQLRMPIQQVPGLEGATDAQLARVEMSPAGVGLAWDELDVDFTVMQLAILALGEKTVMRASAAVAGATRSPAKAAAARANGRKGGRPRKDAAV